MLLEFISHKLLIQKKNIAYLCFTHFPTKVLLLAVLTKLFDLWEYYLNFYVVKLRSIIPVAKSRKIKMIDGKGQVSDHHDILH